MTPLLLWREPSYGGMTTARLHDAVTLALLTQALQALDARVDGDKEAREADGRRLGRFANALSGHGKGVLVTLLDEHRDRRRPRPRRRYARYAGATRGGE